MTLKEWNIILSYITDISDVLPFLCWVAIGKSRGQYKILGAYFFVSFTIKLVTVLLAMEGKNTLPFYHLLAPIEFTLIYFYYCKVIPIQRSLRWITWVLVVSLNAINSISMQKLTEFNSTAWTVNTLVLLAMSLIYLYRLYASIEDFRIERHPGFIINAGLLIYFSGALFTYLLGWYILTQKSESFFANGWIIQSIANFSKNILVTVGLWFAKSQLTTPLYWSQVR